MFSRFVQSDIREMRMKQNIALSKVYDFHRQTITLLVDLLTIHNYMHPSNMAYGKPSGIHMIYTVPYFKRTENGNQYNEWKSIFL